MIAWSRRHTLLAGLALILTVNGVALSGVFLNRSGEPESLVQLSERELQTPYTPWANKENSGVELKLHWRIHSDDTRHDDGYSSYGGTTSWLDAEKLLSLGFKAPPTEQSLQRRMRQQQTREVLLVLEINGAAYRQSLARARAKADEEEKSRQDNPGNKEFEDRARRAREQAEQEAGKNSRLFVVDAGLDVAALRASYPDKTRYLIARGQIRPYTVWREKQATLTGFISGLSIGEINVPLAFQGALPREDGAGKSAGFLASVAYGQRLEPWIVALSGK